MDGSDAFSIGSASPPLRLFERLAQIPGYTWDHSIKPYYSVSAYANRSPRRRLLKIVLSFMNTELR